MHITYVSHVSSIFHMTVTITKSVVPLIISAFTTYKLPSEVMAYDVQLYILTVSEHTENIAPSI